MKILLEKSTIAMALLKELQSNPRLDIVVSSAKVKVGDIFFCDIKAEKYLTFDTIEKASLIYVDVGFFDRNNFQNTEKIIELGNFRDFLVFALNQRYKVPPHLIAITGTKGKTSSCWYVFHLLRSILNTPVSYFGSVGFYCGDSSSYSKAADLDLTTPDIDDIYRIFDTSVARNVQYCVFEASGHGLHQDRFQGVKIEVASFTNLSQDHLDYFLTLDAMFSAKKLLFLKYLADFGKIVVNADIPEHHDIAGISKNLEVGLVSYGKNGATFKLKTAKHFGLKQYIEYSFNSHVYSFETNIIGDFQAYNILNAASILHALNFKHEDYFKFLPSLAAPKGRLEAVEHLNLPNGARVFVDFAHSPRSLYAVIETINSIKLGRLITIFGCGGNRDKIKRPVMGYIAAKLSDITIITTDNPRFEDPQDIINDILYGVEGNIESISHFDYNIAISEIESCCSYEQLLNPKFFTEVDRVDAIRLGVSMLQKDDILLIAGKGHEEYQIIHNDKLHFSDAEVVAEVCKSIF